MIICHQGVYGADMGEYVQDKSAVPAEWLEGRRVVSGHYHKAQTIKCGDTGVWDYIGSPYTITFAEANDGPKGFRVLYSDGSLEQVPTNLRRHCIAEIEHRPDGWLITQGPCADEVVPSDLLWLKVKGPSLELAKVNKKWLAESFGFKGGYKLDKIPTDAPTLAPQELENKTNPELMDLLIDSSEESDETKKELKTLWRSIA